MEYTGHPAAFWGNLLSAAGGNDGKKAVMRLERAEVPAEVLRTATTPAQLDAAGTAAAQKSVEGFLSFVETLRKNSAEPAAQKIMMLEMKQVGIKCEGRSGPYDLLYFPHKDKVYAADYNDDSIVYVLA